MQGGRRSRSLALTSANEGTWGRGIRGGGEAGQRVGCVWFCWCGIPHDSNEVGEGGGVHG